MAQMLIRNLDDDIKARLVRQAKMNGRSAEEEARTILRLALAPDEDNQPSGLGTQWAKAFSHLNFDFEVPRLGGNRLDIPNFNSSDYDP
ncbi:MAG: toxin-antitoxin system [Myxococcales bacterium]|nr:toxin-antitoxin system [Myxococcales bacterium]